MRLGTSDAGAVGQWALSSARRESRTTGHGSRSAFPLSTSLARRWSLARGLVVLNGNTFHAPARPSPLATARRKRLGRPWPPLLHIRYTARSRSRFTSSFRPLTPFGLGTENPRVGLDRPRVRRNPQFTISDRPRAASTEAARRRGGGNEGRAGRSSPVGRAQRRSPPVASRRINAGGPRPHGDACRAGRASPLLREW